MNGPGARRGTLVARFAVVTFVLVTLLTAGNLAVLGWVFQAELERSLQQNLRGAVTGLQATLERHGAVLEAATSALANLPLLKAAMGSGVMDAESLQAIADEQREALRVDLLALLDEAGAARVASPPLTSFPTLKPGSRAQLHALGDALYLVSVSPVEVDGRAIGHAVAGRRLDAAVLRPVRQTLGVEVVLLLNGERRVDTLPPGLLPETSGLPVAGGRLTLGESSFIAQELSLGGGVTAQVLLSTDETGRRLRQTLLLLGAVGALLALGIGVTAVTLVRRELRPLAELTQAATRVVEQDDLRLKLETRGEGEIGALALAFQQMMTKLAEALGQLKHAGTHIGGAVEQMRESSQAQEGVALRQATALTQTSSTTEELARSSSNVASSAQAVADIAARTLSAADAGRETSAALQLSVEQAQRDQRAVADASAALNANIQRIGRMVEFIGQVADKADLLALNAELEGTKAGAAGVGFALVATEMRRLAENVSRSTREIDQQMEAVGEATLVVVTAGEAAQLASERWASLARSSAAQLEQIVEHARETRVAADSIAVAANQQQEGTSELADSMIEVNRQTQKGLEATRQVSAAGKQLATLAKELREVVDRFQVS